MAQPVKSLPLQRLRIVLAPVNAAPLAILALFAAIVTVTAMRLPAGYDGSGGLDVLFALCAIVWTLGFATRIVEPGSRFGAAVQAIALIAGLIFAAALTAASLSPGGWAYLDPELAAIDRVLAPFLDVRAMYEFLDHHQVLYRWFCLIYGTLEWQPFAVLGASVFFGDAKRIDTFVAAWAFGLGLCILPFHVLPAQGAFTFHHFTEHGWPMHPGGNYPDVLAALRSGAMPGLSVDSISGLVTIPSFHACAAVILARSFWSYRVLRWPMVALNAAMAVVAVPVGSHYVIDVGVGAGCGGLAFAMANALARLKGFEGSARRSPVRRIAPA